jgi:pimeloyl-ACP methyl ester carboxylesterase
MVVVASLAAMLISTSRLLIKVLPAPMSSQIVRALAARTRRPKVHGPQLDAMSRAEMLRYGPRGRNVAWGWGWGWGDGPLVILIHGWNGSAAQLAPLATSLAARGFRCVAIDVTGHGASVGSRTGWRHFVDDIAALSAQLGGDVHAYVGHSAGGLAMMAARVTRGVRAGKYVCVCAPSHPFPPIRAIQQQLDPAQRVLTACQNDIARQLGADWRQLESGWAYAGAGSDLLLFYDEADRFVDHTEGDRIGAWCPGATLVKSAAHGHTKVLGAPELATAVATFLLR